MPKNPPEDMTRISPYIYYADVDAALDWLGRAFGFVERLRLAGPDGKIMHAEMEYEDGVIMLGCPSADYQGPGKTGHVSMGIHVYVKDVDAHCEQAREHGAKILLEPADQFYGDRRYDTEDLEGHRWSFATHVRDVSMEELSKG